MRQRLAGRRRDTRWGRLLNFLLGVPLLLRVRSLPAAAGAELFDIHPPEGVTLTNPCVSVVDGQLMVALREVNHVIDGRGRYVPRGDTELRSATWLASLDGDLEVRGFTRLELPPSEGSFEDARMIETDGVLTFFWSRRTVNAGALKHEIVVGELGEGSIGRLRTLRSPHERPVEKNWMPHVQDGDLRVVYELANLEVHRVAPLGLEHVGSLDESLTDLAGHSGSSQLVPWGTGWLGISHWFLWTQGPAKALAPRIYFHHFVRFDRDLRRAQVSAPFIFRKRGIEFCAGLALLDDELWLSFGLDDATAHLARVPIARVDAMFRSAGAG